MRSPEQVLKALNKHGKVSDYKFERLYRILFNEEMFHVAYQRIYAKPGNMTPGTDGKTINRMSLQRINKVIASLRDESYKPNPAKRIYIPKKNGKKRPLGIPSFEDKLVQEVVRMILEAGTGNLIRTKLIKHHFTLFMNIAVSISASCLIYAILLKLAILMFNIPFVHEAGYICSMLFIIPGFPFITSGIDLAKLDLRSGIERLTYSIIIVLVATVFAWIMALLLHLQPEEFTTLHIGKMLHLILRLVASFCGVFGFSIMFNSPVPLAMSAAVIGAISNTLRLELVDLASLPPAAAAFFADDVGLHDRKLVVLAVNIL